MRQWMLAIGAAMLMVPGTDAPLAAQGNAVAPGCGQSPCAQPFSEGGLFGIKDAQGKVTIPPRYTRAYPANQTYPEPEFQGLIIVERDGLVGFVNRQGVETVPPSLKLAPWKAKKGLIEVQQGTKSCMVDNAGKLVVACDNHLIFVTDDPNQFFLVVKGKGGRYVDRSGRTIDYPAPQPARPAAPQAAAAAPAQQVVTLRTTSNAVSYANQGNWVSAVEAAATGSAEDKRIVLTALHAAGQRPSTSDSFPRYNAGIQALRRHPGIFDGASDGASAAERQAIAALYQQAMGSYAPPASGSSSRTGSASSSSSSSGTAGPRRCYQVSRDRMQCFD